MYFVHHRILSAWNSAEDSSDTMECMNSSLHALWLLIKKDLSRAGLWTAVKKHLWRQPFSEPSSISLISCCCCYCCSLWGRQHETKWSARGSEDVSCLISVLEYLPWSGNVQPEMVFCSNRQISENWLIWKLNIKFWLLAAQVTIAKIQNQSRCPSIMIK